ncbi:MAG: class I SAM-dependent methyltransferase, partial [Acidimicrobiia bacterium]
QLGLGYQQVVILGAGLDTRAVRKQAPGVIYFEIDDRETVSLKKAKLEENGIHVNVKFIPGDYVADDFIKLLEQNDFDVNRPTHFIWEGNTMYLTPDSVKRVMADIVKYLRQFTLSFDYMAEEVIAKTTGDPGVTTLVESLRIWVTHHHSLVALTLSCFAVAGPSAFIGRVVAIQDGDAITIVDRAKSQHSRSRLKFFREEGSVVRSE